MDARRARLQLETAHNILRNEGLNPLEALAVVSNLLVEARPVLEEYPALRQVGVALAETGAARTLAIALQQFLSDDLRAAFGQYLTPAPVAAHISDLLNTPASQRTVLDPFAGSGLLLEAVGERVDGARLIGIEINPAVAQVCRAVASASSSDITVVLGDAFRLWVGRQLPGANDVAANPPFGGRVSNVNREDLQALGACPSLVEARSGLPAEILALELCIAAVSEGGKVAIVLPSSVLTNERWSRFRAEYFARYTLKHVTSLPPETFVPFRGVTNACVVLVEKRTPPSYPYHFKVWQSQSVGYDGTGRSNGDPDLSADRVRHAGFNGTADADGSVVLHKTHDATNGRVTLGAIAHIFRGKNPARDQYTPSGPYLLKVGGLSGSFVSWRTRARSHVPVEWFAGVGDRQLEVGDICLTATAHTPRYIGLKVDMIDKLPESGAAASGEVMVIRLREGATITALQLLFYLRSPEGRSALQSRVRGSTAHIYPRDVATLVIPPLMVDTEALSETFGAASAAYREYLQLEDEAYRISGLHERPEEDV